MASRLRALDPADAPPGAPLGGAHAASVEQVSWPDHPATKAWDEYRRALGADADRAPPP